MATRPNTLMVRLSDEEKAAVETMAQTEQRTRSDMARILINEAVKARGEK